ncbi:isoleucine--tRNA ligase [Pelagibius litoralis]|uniref:Isoleucine--tRNA ligase n=1 Tax=Pelagibius litoralis TaxID=374515 RepID=A0A967F158_9PROT|nr:isoleucine--tRNA ligase [Pelagibius litoralis]NIA71165.1 isoleucine--tRNA ligase [Pelagibius litoralis]
MSVDYKATVFLPKTEFPMRAGLAKREPETLARWAEMDLFARQREASQGREKFILHDGPPYANGHLHIGHALNKILKDVINRAHQMLGKNAHYVPGWDCHGLPIEWKIEEQYRAAGKDKDAVPVLEFRRECRDFAAGWVKVQTEEFKRLGVLGDWERPYTTMSFDAEAQIVREIGKFLDNGGIYKGSRPVLWSVVERTALADAEVEYHDHVSQTIWVRFPVVKATNALLEDASVLIWTTTPWTIPGNRAIGFGEEIAYGVWQVETLGEDSHARVGEKLVLAKDLAETVKADAKIESWTHLGDLPSGEGSGLAGTLCAHPWRDFAPAEGGYGFNVPLLPGDFVTTEQGTGFVHIAPGHGADDWALGLQHGIEIPQTVDGTGAFYEHVPLLAGALVYDADGKPGDANGRVIKALAESERLLHKSRLKHSYPHSWRSKAPLIFRNTPQWFISMETNDLRKKALKAIDETRFVPGTGRNRLRSMIEQRPDWCISRQRLWGVPLPIFVEKKSGEPLRDPAVVERVATAFEEEGGDAWFSSDPQRFLGNEYKAEDYEQITDVVEVWFDSGSTHSFVLEARPELKWPADLYLEGSDQHRGWFHTSLLESAGTRGRAPYDAVLTHGFILEEQGKEKMSKSRGNALSPQDVVDNQGADILRLWVVASNYEEDLRFGPDILKYQGDAYRRLRNTLRYLLGNLDGFHESERLAAADMPELERWVLHRLAEIDAQVRKNVEDFDFHALYQAVYTFCAVDLSAFYFDVRKDVLYCDRPDSLRRRACRTVLDEVFSCLTAWLAPILCFTAEEAWWTRGAGPEESVHLRTFPEVPAGWRDDVLADKWSKVRDVRRVVTGALELERADKRLGSSLQGHPEVFIGRPELLDAVRDVALDDIAITSAITLTEGDGPAEAFRLEDVSGVAVSVSLAEGDKCQRCWKVLPEVGRAADAPETCARCADALQHLGAAAQ